MLRIVPSTASVAVEIRFCTKAWPALTSQFQIETTIAPGRLLGVARRRALKKPTMVLLIQFAAAEQGPSVIARTVRTSIPAL